MVITVESLAQEYIVLKRTRLNMNLSLAANKYQNELAIKEAEAFVAQQAKPLKVPKCPSCGGRMLLKTNKFNGTTFFGCTNFPSCKKTVNIP